jgi:hypothetical protein
MRGRLLRCSLAGFDTLFLATVFIYGVGEDDLTKYTDYVICIICLYARLLSLGQV